MLIYLPLLLLSYLYTYFDSSLFLLDGLINDFYFYLLSYLIVSLCWFFLSYFRFFSVYFSSFFRFFFSSSSSSSLYTSSFFFFTALYFPSCFLTSALKNSSSYLLQPYLWELSKESEHLRLNLLRHDSEGIKQVVGI